MILGTSRAVRVYAYPEAVDLRKGYDGLYGLVRQGLACGFLGLDRPPYAHATMFPVEVTGTPPYLMKLGEASYGVCPCCAFEFGNDDEPGTAPPSTFFGVSRRLDP
jgi:hypothetical protein